ncbi:MAG: hypothetical protein R2724_27600 [Bryobacterales bacterium]
MRVKIDNDTDLTNNLKVFGEDHRHRRVVADFGDASRRRASVWHLTEGNLSQWSLEAYRGDLAVNPGCG